MSCPPDTRACRCEALAAENERLRKAGEPMAKAMDNLAMATPDRVLRSVAQEAARKFRAALRAP